MAWSISDLFPSWGESGSSPADGFFYEGGDQVNEKHLDYLWDSLKTLENQIRSALTDIDSDGDGVVDEADTANLYKGNDIDSDGDGKVDAADTADTAGSAVGVFELADDLTASDGEIIWDESESHIPSENVESVSTEIDLKEYQSINDAPDPANVTNPQIAYLQDEDDYVGVFQQ